MRVVTCCDVLSRSGLLWKCVCVAMGGVVDLLIYRFALRWEVLVVTCRCDVLEIYRCAAC